MTTNRITFPTLPEGFSWKVGGWDSFGTVDFHILDEEGKKVATYDFSGVYPTEFEKGDRSEEVDNLGPALFVEKSLQEFLRITAANFAATVEVWKLLAAAPKGAVAPGTEVEW